MLRFFFYVCILAAVHTTFVYGLGLSLDSSPSPHADCVIIWFRTVDSDPTSFTLQVIPPNGAQIDSYSITGNTSGTQTITLGDPGNYELQALGPPPEFQEFTKTNFTVPDNTTGGGPSTTVGTDPASTTGPPGNSSAHTHGNVFTSSKSHSTSNATSTAGPTNTTSVVGPSSSLDSVTTSASPSPSVTASNPQSDLSASTWIKSHTGIFVGAVIGGIAFILITAVVLFFTCRNFKRLRPVSFHRDMMVRSPGPSLYPGSRAASPFSVRAASPFAISSHPFSNHRTTTSTGSPSSYTDLLAQATSKATHSPQTPATSNPNPFRDPASLTVSQQPVLYPAIYDPAPTLKLSTPTARQDYISDVINDLEQKMAHVDVESAEYGQMRTRLELLHRVMSSEWARNLTEEIPTGVLSSHNHSEISL